jgi:hypothetical protein
MGAGEHRVGKEPLRTHPKINLPEACSGSCREALIWIKKKYRSKPQNLGGKGFIGEPPVRDPGKILISKILGPKYSKQIIWVEAPGLPLTAGGIVQNYADLR